MATNAQQTARCINVTRLSEEAIQAVESIVIPLRERANDHAELQQSVPDLTSLEQGLDELLEGLPILSTLPDDFSRADIYGEHP
jgi:hypothetical protein